MELEDQATDQGMNHGTDSEVVAATKKRKLEEYLGPLSGFW
jgi:hypothetical protein